MYDKEGRELEKYTLVIGATIAVEDGGSVKKGQSFVKWDPYNVPILSEQAA
jgi:DNA-directed RNA polymerase subunit beta'